MNNPQVLEIIENLKGRRNYEEKKASKLGFNSLYAYIENKILKEKEAEAAKILEQSAPKEEVIEEKKFRHIAVTEEDKIVGMLSVKDLQTYYLHLHEKTNF